MDILVCQGGPDAPPFKGLDLVDVPHVSIPLFPFATNNKPWQVLVAPLQLLPNTRPLFLSSHQPCMHRVTEVMCAPHKSCDRPGFPGCLLSLMPFQSPSPQSGPSDHSPDPAQSRVSPCSSAAEQWLVAPPLASPEGPPPTKG